MARRLFPALLLLLFLGLAGGLLAIPYLVQDRSPVAAPATPLTFADEIGGIGIDGRLDLAPDSSFTVAVRLAGRHDAGGGLPGPGLALTMPEHPMPPLAPVLESRGNGLFEASGTLPMPGHWELRLDLPEGSTVIAFRLDG